jgi:hypothetical protein
MSWFQIGTLAIGIVGILVLLGIVNILSDIAYKLGHVVASDDRLQHVQGELSRLNGSLEDIERAVSRIQGAQVDAQAVENDDDN